MAVKLGTFAVLLFAGMTLLTLRARTPVDAQSPSPVHPTWTQADTVEPADLSKEIGGAAAVKPTIVCVGLRALYRAGHIPGASFHGPASTAAGLEDLKTWARGVSRATPVVVYCGCCPIAVCPNLAPAFKTLHDMGFTHLRVLMLRQNFGTDWVAKGYTVERAE